MRIIGPPSAPEAAVRRALTDWETVQRVHPRLIDDMLPALWAAAIGYLIDPVGVVAQAFKETGGGFFRGNVRPEFYNPCGLKVRHNALFPGVTDADNPLAHQMFPNWPVGATAHVQHLCAYAGWSPNPDALIVDPRYGYVAGKHRIEAWAELGGRWAPSATYGAEIEAVMRDLAG